MGKASQPVGTPTHQASEFRPRALPLVPRPEG